MKKQQLTAAEVSRAGKTARTWNDETTKVTLASEKASLVLEFSLRSKGGGVTDVRLTIGPADFAALMVAMATAERSTTMEQAAIILASELGRQSACDKALAREARNSVTAAARQAYQQAPRDRNHAERLTRDMVSGLVDRLNQEDNASAEE